MNPFRSICKWKRKDFAEDPDQTKGLRHLAEVETDRDLQKPVQQLLCDVHEESLNPLPPIAPGETEQHWNERLAVLQLQRLVGAQKRMVSLQTVSTFQTGRTNALIFWLTLVVVAQTSVLIWLTLHPRKESMALSPNAMVDSGSLKKAAKIGEGEVTKLKGRITAYTPGVNPGLYLYNGTEWNVTDVDIWMTNRKSGEERKFRFFASELEVKRNEQGKIIETNSKKIFIAPLTEGPMDCSIGEFLSGVESSNDWSWSLVAAYGFKT